MAIPGQNNSAGLVIFLVLSSSFLIANVNTHYTKEERDALDKFRPMVMDSVTNEYQMADSYLIRWLRAKELNVNAARKMFMETLKWRAYHKMDDILEENIILDGFDFPDSMDENDNEGSPVMTYTFAKMDFRRMLLEGKKDKLFRLFMQRLEKLGLKAREASNRTGTDISQSVHIGDYQGFNRKQHLCIECFTINQAYVETVENHYPGFLKLQVFINTPRIYSVLFKRTVDLQSPHTRKTTKIFATDRTEWSAYLDKLMAPETRTYQFGGTKN